MAGFAAHEQRVAVGAAERPDLDASIRHARSSELDEIADLFAPALAPYRGGVQDWILDAYLAELVDVRPRFEEAEVLVAEHDQRIVGTIAFYPDVRLEGWSTLPGGWAEDPSIDVFFVVEDEEVRPEALAAMAELRRAGRSAETDYAGRSQKGQLTQAGRLRSDAIVIAGRNGATVRRSGQHDVEFPSLAEAVKSL